MKDWIKRRFTGAVGGTLQRIPEWKDWAEMSVLAMRLRHTDLQLQRVLLT